MAQIPLPERGQPLDVTYIYQVVDALNSLTKQVSDTGAEYSVVDVVGQETKNQKTSNTKFVGKFKQIATAETVTAGQEKSYLIDYPSFKFPPIITVSVVNKGGTTAGANTTIVLGDITTTQANFTVRYSLSGTATIGVNLIAIGVPN